MLASTVQFSTNTKPEPHTPQACSHQRATVLKADPDSLTQPHMCWLPQNLNRVLATSHHQPHRTRSFHATHAAVLNPPAVAEENFTSVSANEHPTTSNASCGLLPPFQTEALLRKEVIQPHLPVRLPCYDFVPIASPTFDGSPPYGLGHRLRVLPTFVT